MKQPLKMLSKKALSKELVMHKLVGEHDWRAIATYSDPYLVRCAVCGLEKSEPYGAWSGLGTHTTGSGGAGMLTMSGLDNAWNHLFISGSTPTQFYASPKTANEIKLTVQYDES